MSVNQSESWFRQFGRVFIIAELGINHNGDPEVAEELIRQAAKAKADAVKVQLRDLADIYTETVINDPLKSEHGTQYLLNELQKAHLDLGIIKRLSRLANELGLLFFGTPFDLDSARKLASLDVPCIKVGSPDLTNLQLLRDLSTFGKPLLISTGMSTEDEISQVVQKLNSWGVDYALLHCNSTYPAAPADINLRFMDRLRTLSQRVVGYSGHERGYIPTLAAVARGASIIERHLTLDTMAPGPDHSSSLEPEEFASMVTAIRDVELSLGLEKRVINQGEKLNRVSLAKSLVASRDFPAGHLIAPGDLSAKTPARGVSPLELPHFEGKRLNQPLKKDEYIHHEHVADDNGHERGSYEIPLVWGVVGRLNDFKDFLPWRPKLIEIHLTWRDLVAFNPDTFLPGGEDFEQNLVVHAPEYYKDELIDFATDDPKIREHSIEMLRLTTDLARALAPRFRGLNGSRGPRIVVHPGGHFESQRETNRTDQYRFLRDNLREVNADGVELLVENMPPLPWYFGGQWVNTVFLSGKDVATFAKETGFGVCYDMSHALLACNFAKTSIESFTEEIRPYVRHLHVADAAGVTQEGLQLGVGELPLEHLMAVLESIDCGFVTEIWNGHLNSGDGFHRALSAIDDALKGRLATQACCGCGDSTPHDHRHLLTSINSK